MRQSNDLPDYTEMLQKTYQDSYTNEEIGLTKQCFSKEIFNTKDTQKYLKSGLEVNDKQKTWLAYLGEELVGSITIIDKDKDCEVRGFYVTTNYQRKGIGKKLWKLTLKFAKNKNITLDIYTHNTKTIALYKKWGFQIDKDRGEFYRHWREWPKDVKAKCIYMIYRTK